MAISHIMNNFTNSFDQHTNNYKIMWTTYLIKNYVAEEGTDQGRSRDIPNAVSGDRSLGRLCTMLHNHSIFAKQFKLKLTLPPINSDNSFSYRRKFSAVFPGIFVLIIANTRTRCFVEVIPNNNYVSRFVKNE